MVGRTIPHVEVIKLNSPLLVLWEPRSKVCVKGCIFKKIPLIVLGQPFRR